MIFKEHHFAPVSNVDAVEQALANIESEAQDTKGLITRWPALNRAVMKHFRFETIYTIAGASGSAKSYLMNMIKSDFTDYEDIIIPMTDIPDSIIKHVTTNGEFVAIGNDLVRKALNPELPFKPVFLYFGIEMSPAKENIRTLATMTGYDYAYLHSSQSTSKDEKGFDIYNKISAQELNFFKKVLTQFGKRSNILPFKLSPNIEQFKATIYSAAERYPDNPLIIGFDHTLLFTKTAENGDRELSDNIIKACIEVRDATGAMIFPITQMNSEIEDDKRRNSPALHFPTKKDIYMGGQMFQGSDFVFTMFAPSSIFLTAYGPQKIPTANLIHMGLIKSRNGNTGHIWLQNRLDIGKILPLAKSVTKDTISGNEIVTMSPIPSLINSVL